MRPKTIIGKSAFEGYKNECVIERKNFTIEKSGALHRIVDDSGVHSFLVSEKTKGETSLLQACKIVKSDAIQFLNTKNADLPPSDLFIPTEYTCFENLKEGQTLVSIDVEACYWRTAYLLGVISLKTYLKFLTLKHERNVAIGCLKRKTEQVVFYNGKEIKRRSIENELTKVNVHIKKYIYDIFLQVKEDFNIVFYHTDEFWVSLHNAESLKKFLEQKGFRTKSDVLKIEKISHNGLSCRFLKANCSKFVRKKRNQ
jgi:hypothetical protein